MSKYNKRPKTLSDFSLDEIKSTSHINENGCWEKWYQPTAKLDGRTIKLARITLALANPSFDINNPKVYACHKCDNERCVNPAHLFPGASSDNQRDYWKKVKDGKLVRWAGGQQFNTVFGPLNTKLKRGWYRPRWLKVDEE